MLRAEIEALARDGLLGADVCGSGGAFEIEIFVSPGGYILGEETALLECMEGNRGEPRNKPPFPGTTGCYGQPTLINNVETFADVPGIVERGAEWWKARAQRRHGAEVLRGLRRRRAAGRVRVPMGTTARELIELAGGVTRRRGAAGVRARRRVVELPRPRRSSTCRSTSTPLAEAGSMLGSGAVVVVAEGTDLLGPGDERGAVLPQRVVRQVRALPGRLGEGARDPRARSSQGLGADDGARAASPTSRRRWG